MRKRWVRYTAIPRQTPPNNKAFPRDPVAPSRLTNLELDHLVASSLQLSDQARLRLAQRQHFLLQRLEQGAVVLPSYFVRAHHGFVRSHHGEAGGELVPPQGRRKVFGEKNKTYTHTHAGARQLGYLIADCAACFSARAGGLPPLHCVYAARRDHERRFQQWTGRFATGADNRDVLRRSLRATRLSSAGRVIHVNFIVFPAVRPLARPRGRS